MGGYLILGSLEDKDPTIWGTILGSPIFGNPQIGVTFVVQCGPETLFQASRPLHLLSFLADAQAPKP